MRDHLGGEKIYFMLQNLKILVRLLELIKWYITEIPIFFQKTFERRETFLKTND